MVIFCRLISSPCISEPVLLSSIKHGQIGGQRVSVGSIPDISMLVRDTLGTPSDISFICKIFIIVYDYRSFDVIFNSYILVMLQMQMLNLEIFII